MSRINHVTTLGSGVLGGQIAWHSAFRGKSVVAYDLTEDALSKCRAAHDQYAAIYRADVGATDEAIARTRARLSYTTDLGAALASADLVIESVPEVPEIKASAYRTMAPLLREHTLLATNSSTLLPSDFAAATGRPEQFCALHFANLIWIMNVAEVMAHATTADDTLTQVTEFAIEIGMVPIALRKEQNGYVINTWFVALLNAAQSLVTNGVSTPEDVDRSFLICNRGCAMGPMAMIDMVGMQTSFNVLMYWGTRNDDQQMLRNAEYIKTRFIDRGEFGLPTGKGYYSYPNPAFQARDFLAVPDASRVPEFVALARPPRT
jgi:3-hydroxybutyryl-CoA dehydrogenase